MAMTLKSRATARITPEQGRLALQRLLTERFRLQSHQEKVRLPGYRLMVSATGAKLLDEKEEDAFRKAHADKPPFKEGWAAIFTGKDLPGFAERLGRSIGRIIIDDTGISGSYWFQLEWVPDPDQPGGDGASLRAAIEQQLGLKLVEESVPGVLMIVDSVAKPKH